MPDETPLHRWLTAEEIVKLDAEKKEYHRQVSELRKVVMAPRGYVIQEEP